MKGLITQESLIKFPNASSTERAIKISTMKCSKCKKEKELADFSKSNTVKSGFQSICKHCFSLYRKERRKELSEYQKAYKKTEKGKKLSEKWEKTRLVKDKKKILARAMVRDHIKSGKLVRKVCEVCGNIDSHGHHTDYSLPLLVRWLCRKHHSEEHSKMKVS